MPGDRRVRMWVAPVLVAVLAFLPGPAGGRRAAGAAAGGHPPVVMVVFDEFSLTQLLDRQQRIDPVLFPNFARLAGQATVYRNLTAPGDQTSEVMGALLAGSAYRRDTQPTLANYPRNLFTAFARRYRMHVWEEASALCPPKACPGDPRVHGAGMLHELGGGRPERFAAWIRQIRPSSRPTFHFKHVLLPHVPLQYLPSGRRYRMGAGEDIPGVTRERSFRDGWLVTQAWQRELLQTAFVDRLLGRLLDRLHATGLYDRALIVLTADNGESYGRRNVNRHVASRATVADIATTPLIVKRPLQRTGAYDDRHVRTADLVPTIAHLAGVPVNWRTAGRVAFGPGARPIPGRVVVFLRGRGQISMSLREFQARARAWVLRKASVFGSDGQGPGLYGIGPHRELVGRRVADLPAAPAGGVSARLVAGRRYAHVSLGGPFSPTYVTAWLRGRGLRRGLGVAVTVNGTIATTAYTARLDGSRAVFVSALMPETALRRGFNRVRILLLSRRGGKLALAPL